MLFVNWQAIPFIRLVIPFILGILTVTYFQYSLPFPITLLSTIFILSIAILYTNRNIQKSKYLGVWINIVFFLFGWQVTYWNNPITKSTHYQHIISNNTNNKTKIVIGHIVNIPVTKNTTKVELAVEQMGNHVDSLVNVQGKLLCYIEKNDSNINLEYGKRISFEGFINSVEKPKNPNQFNYKQFLAYKQIHHQTYITSANWQLLKSENKNILSWISKIRSKRLKQIKKHINGEAEQGVAMALLLGFKEELSEDVKAAYSETGAIHVLAVSGLHVGIVAFILKLILNLFRWRKRKKLKTLLIILPLWFYALLTGFSPSVIRATVMFTLIIIGLERSNRPDIYNVLGASALILLLFNPYFIFSVGFQLSYAAVFGIVYFHPKFMIWYEPKHLLFNYFWKLTMVSVAATLGTLPFTLFYFHQFPVWFWLSSAIAIPAAGLILSLGLGFFTIGLIPFVDVFFGTIIQSIIQIMNWCIQLIHHFPFAIIKGLWFTDIEFYLILLSILSFGFLLQTRKIRWSLYSISFIGFLIGSSCYNHWQTQQQKSIVIYSISNTTAIDFIDGQSVTCFQSDNFNHRNYSFSSQSHHWKSNIQSVDSISIDENIDKKQLQKQDNLIQFYDKIVLIIDNKNQIPSKSITIDYLILRNNPKVEITQLIEKIKFKKIIFDSSNKYWKIKNWKLECQALNIDYQDVRNDFAFVLDF